MRETRLHRFAVSAALPLAGCFHGAFDPPDRDATPHAHAALSRRVSVALEGRKADALTYAGLYAVLADRLEKGGYSSTGEAAAVAGRAAEILAVPGVLGEVVNDELNPILGKPGPVTPELSAKAAVKLRALSSACREAAR